MLLLPYWHRLLRFYCWIIEFYKNETPNNSIIVIVVIYGVGEHIAPIGWLSLAINMSKQKSNYETKCSAILLIKL